MLGSPIAHSLSPALHRAAYAALGLGWAYDAHDVTATGLADFLDGLGPEWAGLSLTMPLKQTVLPLLDEVSDLAQQTGAANTILLGDGRRRGDNTDVAGMLAALAERGVLACGTGVILGGGATAASALAALAALGERSPVVLVRDLDRAGRLREAAERLDVTPQVRTFEQGDLTVADVVISTVPAGAMATVTATTALAGVARGVLLDVAYDPWPTPLAAAWAGPVVGGAVMLLHQAAAQVELMTGRTAPVEAMRAALPPALLI